MTRTPHRELPAAIRRTGTLALWVSLLSMLLVIVVEGYQLAEVPRVLGAMQVVWLAAVGLSAAYEWLIARRAIRRLDAFESVALDGVLLVVVLVILVVGSRSQLALAVFVRQAIFAARFFLSTPRGQRLLVGLLAQPAKLLAGSFLAVILVGALFLTFPRATTDGEGAAPVDALFTATSATCVTGLAVLNTNDDAAANPAYQSFTSFGQVVIFVLVQVGGLGIMTLSTSLMLLMGRRLGVRSQALMQDVMEEESRRDLERTLRYVVTSTFIVEALGALILFLRFWPAFGDVRSAFFYAVFHSVSAYCNAGFALWGDNLTAFREDWTVMITVMSLITVGGLGSPVLAALLQADNLRRPPQVTWARLPVHVRVVLLVSIALVLAGAVGYYYFDYDASLRGLPVGEKIMASFFQSVTMRTAGFNTVDLSQISRVSLVLCVLLMIVGGSPGGTAGGVKTSTMAVAFLSVRAMILGREEVEVGGRTIPKTIVYKAVSIVLIYLCTLAVCFLIMLVAEEDKSFESLLFEAVSALGTVGVSLGITPKLTVAGKVVIMLLMFVGRIGPLTLALAVGERARRVALRYPEGRIVVG